MNRLAKRGLSVRLRASVNPSEDPSKVRAAILNLFPEANLETREGEVLGEAKDLGRLEELIRNHQIPDTARGVLLSGQNRNRTRFKLAKQAAFVGVPGFGATKGAGGPLGDIEVEVEAATEGDLALLIYETAFDTTCDPKWARVPPELRPKE